MKHQIQEHLEQLFRELTHSLEDWLLRNSKNRHKLKGDFSPESMIFKRRNDGVNINGKQISKKLSYENVLINGGSGSFKTVGSIIKTCIVLDQDSLLIHDPSRELFKNTSGAKHQQGADISIIDYERPELSARFNPILRCASPAQVAQLAHMLVFIGDGSSGGDSSFFNNKAVEVLVIIITILKTQEEQYQTLFQVANIIDKMMDKTSACFMDQFFIDFAEKEIFDRYKATISTSEATLSSILSNAKSAVAMFQMDSNLAKITSSDSLGVFEDYRKEFKVLYVHSSTTKMKYYSKISSILFQQFFDVFFSKLPEENDRSVFCIFEEMPVLTINDADIIASNIRKYRGNLTVVCQNAKAQLTAKYGKDKAEAILTSLRTKAYFSMDLATAKDISTQLGSYEYKDEETGQVKTRPVLTVDELMALPEDKTLITVTNMGRPIISRMLPFFKEPKIRRLSELPPYQPELLEDYNKPVPLLDFEAMYPECNETTREDGTEE